MIDVVWQYAPRSTRVKYFKKLKYSKESKTTVCFDSQEKYYQTS